MNAAGWLMEQGAQFFGAVPKAQRSPADPYLFCVACGCEMTAIDPSPDAGIMNVPPSCDQCGEPRNHRFDLLRSAGIASVHCAWSDDGPAAESLRAWKGTPGNEVDCTSAGCQIGEMLLHLLEEGRRLDGAYDRAHVLVPVPGWWGRRFRRGFDPPQRLAEGISAILGWGVCSALVRVQRGRMAGKTRAQRHQSARHLFRLCHRGKRKLPKQCHLWLVDDVLASGATSSAAARILRQVRPFGLHLVVANVRN